MEPKSEKTHQYVYHKIQPVWVTKNHATRAHQDLGTMKPGSNSGSRPRNWGKLKHLLLGIQHSSKNLGFQRNPAFTFWKKKKPTSNESGSSVCLLEWMCGIYWLWIIGTNISGTTYRSQDHGDIFIQGCWAWHLHHIPTCLCFWRRYQKFIN